MSASPSGATRRTVTVLFCDIVDSTPLGEALDPEALRTVMADYYEAARGVLERHGGTVEKFIGDAVMAVFGIPTLHEDDALRAVRAASELQAAVGGELRVRVGVATGEVVAGDHSEGQAFATGETVVTAERLEKAAGACQALIDDVTYRLVADAVEVDAVEPVAAKGKARPVAAWRLVEVRPGALGVARRFDTPLVGRDSELAALRRAFDEAVAERRCRLVTVLGPAGIGKSRLVREFLRETGPRATVRVGRCPSYGEGITFWPVLDVLPDMTLRGTTDEIFWRVRTELEDVARAQPLVVCFEDVHWAEPTFLNLVEYLRGLVSDAPILVICLARQELLDRRAEWLSTAVTLGPLSQPDTQRLLDVLGAPAGARPHIAEAAEGNPLFVEQMAAMASDAGTKFVVPPSIRTLLAARLDRLSARERAVVERAAVIGREFPLRAVVALAGDELRSEVADHVLALVRKELVEPQLGSFGADDAFRFRHGLIRDAAYDGIPKALRAELHERYAGWFDEFRREDVVVGYHLEQSFRLRQELGTLGEEGLALAREGGNRLADAGERAYRRDDAAAATNLLTRAVRLLPPSSPRRPVLLVELGSALMKAGRFAEAETVLDDAFECARAAGDRRSELWAVVERQQLRSFTDPAAITADIARVAAEVIPELEDLGDDPGLAKAWRLLSDVHLMGSRFEARADALERALEHARRAPDARSEVPGYIGLLAHALHWGPTPAPVGIARCRQFLAEAGDNLSLRAGVGATLAAMLATTGEFEEARSLYRESAALHEQLGLAFRGAVAALFGAEIELLADDPEAAEWELRRAYETLEEMGETGTRAVVSAFLAAVVCTLGRDEEARRLARLAAEIADPGDAFAQVLERATTARLLARSGELEAAEARAREALELAAATDCTALETTAGLALADVLEAAGQTAEARGQLERARDLYEAKGNVVEARRLTALVARAAPRA